MSDPTPTYGPFTYIMAGRGELIRPREGFELRVTETPIAPPDPLLRNVGQPNWPHSGN